MSQAPSFWQSRLAAAAAGLILCLTPACKPSAPKQGPAKPAAPRANPLASATNDTAPQNVSVFADLMPPKGRDPFFPNSHRRDPAPVAAAPGVKPPPASELMLKGVVGAPKHRMAVINNAILEAGESGTVRVPSGRVKVKCLEIGENFAVVAVEGQIQQKRLELNKKGF